MSTFCPKCTQPGPCVVQSDRPCGNVTRQSQSFGMSCWSCSSCAACAAFWCGVRLALLRRVRALLVLVDEHVDARGPDRQLLEPRLRVQLAGFHAVAVLLYVHGPELQVQVVVRPEGAVFRAQRGHHVRVVVLSAPRLAAVLLGGAFGLPFECDRHAPSPTTAQRPIANVVAWPPPAGGI